MQRTEYEMIAHRLYDMRGKDNGSNIFCQILYVRWKNN